MCVEAYNEIVLYLHKYLFANVWDSFLSALRAAEHLELWKNPVPKRTWCKSQWQEFTLEDWGLKLESDVQDWYLPAAMEQRILVCPSGPTSVKESTKQTQERSYAQNLVLCSLTHAFSNCI